MEHLLVCPFPLPIDIISAKANFPSHPTPQQVGNVLIKK
jgi:hypothetical protein